MHLFFLMPAPPLLLCSAVPAKVRFKRRTPHVPNLIQCGAATELVWRDSCFKRRTGMCRS